MQTDAKGVEFNPNELDGEEFFKYSQDPDTYVLPVEESQTKSRLNGYHPEEVEDLPSLPEIVSGGELFREYPDLREIIIEGILRKGETCNLIASPKVGKSWFVLMLAISVAAGRGWFGRNVRKCRVLIIDNELHLETLAFRFQKVTYGMGLKPGEVDVDFISLRGRLMDISQYHRILEKAKADYDLIIIDAKYRAQLSGASENSNTDEANFYNTLDKLAGDAAAAIIVVHHSSKGNQSDKSVTDTGAGAGAQSRAADAHLVIRPHEEDGYFVLDGVVRSFQPIESTTIQLEWPVWKEVTEVEPILKQPKGRGDAKQEAKDAEGRQEIIDSIKRGKNSKNAVRSDIGMGLDRCNRLFRQLLDNEEIKISGTDTNRNGSEFETYETTNNVGANLNESF